MNCNVKNQKIREILGWEPMGSNKDAIVAVEDSMVEYGMNRD